MPQLVSTDFIADLFERSRALIVFVLAAITAVSVWAFLPKRSGSATEGRSAESAARDQSGSGLDSRPGDCLLVLDVEDFFTPESTSAVRHVVREISRLEFVRQVFWLDDVPTINLFGLADPILPPDDASLGRFQAARERATNHPLAKGQLISSDGKTLLVTVSFDWMFVDSDEQCTSALVDLANDILDQHAGVDAKAQITGRVPIYLAYKHAIDRNDLKFQIIGYSMALLLAVFIFRGVAAVVIVSIPPALGIFWSLAMVKLMADQHNPLTNSVMPVLISMVGLTDGVHLMIHIRKQRALGVSSIEAAKSAIRNVGLACALTSITTAIGFGSLMLAHHEVVRGFGRACAIGVLITFVAVVTVIPLLCTTWFGRNVHKGHEHDIIGKNIGFIAPLIDWVMTHAWAVSVIGIVLTVGLGLVTLSLRPDDRTADSQPAGSAAYKALSHFDQAFGGIDPIGVVVGWSEDVSSESPQILAVIEEVERIIDAEPLVQNPISIRNFVDAFGGEPDLESRMSYLALMPEQLKQRYFDPEAREAALNARVQDLGIAKYVPVFERIEQNLQALGEKYPDFSFRMTGNAVRRAHDLYQIVMDLATSLGTATVIILVVMAITYQSFRIGLITLVPNLFPLVVTGTGLVLSGQALDVSGVCAFTICLGIAVDDTIHFLTRYQQELQSDGDSRGAIRRSFFGVGSALIMTTIILVSCFSTVLTSELRGHRTFAAMACSTIGAALVGDLLFLPALLLVFSKRESATSLPQKPEMSQIPEASASE